MNNEFLKKCMKFDVSLPLSNPRAWIEQSVKQHKPELLNNSLIQDLLGHLMDFLSIDEIYENLDLGGLYECEIRLGDHLSQWTFEIGQDNPYRATLSLYPTPSHKEGR